LKIIKWNYLVPGSYIEYPSGLDGRGGWFLIDFDDEVEFTTA